jgi:hypothetical protein
MDEDVKKELESAYKDAGAFLERMSSVKLDNWGPTAQANLVAEVIKLRGEIAALRVTIAKKRA